jgi:thiamine biosynthesis protein ThiS
LTIRVNGEPHEVAGPMTLSDLLAELQIDPRRVAVEHNLTIVRRERYGTTTIEEGDEIEIVNFVGGGGSTVQPLNRSTARRFHGERSRN